MEKLEKALRKLQDLIKKKSISFKDGENLSSPKTPKVQKPESPEAPGIPKPASFKSPNSKKDPKKVAEQIQEPELKAQVMKEAVKISKNGQWKLNKN